MGELSGSASDDSVELFLADLRRLRDDKVPTPSFKQMEVRAVLHGDSVAKTTLHKVYASPSLPSEKALRSYVFALTQDEGIVQNWVKRWAKLAPEPVPPPSPRRRRFWPPLRWIAGVGALVIISNVLTALITVAVLDDDSGSGPTATGSSGESVQTGTDPISEDTCRQDAQIAASTRQNPEFLMKIIFSPTCNAAWGKVERTDTLGHGNTITITTYRSDDPGGPATQRAHEPDVQSAFTNMIVRRDPTDRICVTASITIAGRTITSSAPLCT